MHRQTQCTEKKAAKDEKIAFLAQLREGAAPGDMAKWTINRAVDHWLEWRKATSGSRWTLKKDEYVGSCLKKYLGGVRLEAITAQTLETHQARRLKDMGPAQVNREIRHLAILLKKAKLWVRLCDDYKPLKVNQEVTARALTSEQARFLLDVAATYELPSGVQEGAHIWEVVGWCAALALNTGLRGGELKGIQLGKLETEPPALWVGRGTTKTDAGARRIPLNPVAQWALERLRNRATALGASQPKHYLLPGCRSRHTKAIDPLHGGMGYDPTSPQVSLRSAWESLCGEAGRRWVAKHKNTGNPFENFKFHWCRHTFITHCGMAGVPIATIQSIVGHMTSVMTMHYLHLFDAATRSVVNKVQESMGLEAPPAFEVRTPVGTRPN